MDYINLGNTGTKVTRLCLGMMTYGAKSWRKWVLEEAESRPFIKRALELGFNFFDTADMYSLGVSEEILGRALKEFNVPRDRVVLATKVFNPMGNDPNQGGLSRKHIFHSIDDSLRRLQTDYVDLYQIHEAGRVDHHRPAKHAHFLARRRMHVEEHVGFLRERPLPRGLHLLGLGGQVRRANRFRGVRELPEQLPDAAGLHRFDFQTRQTEFEPVAKQTELFAVGKVRG